MSTKKNTPLRKRKIMNIILSDMHCGSDRAVFPPTINLPPLMADERERTLHYSNTQKALYDHFIKCARYIKKEFGDYQKVFTHNGDAIEGIHHRTIQLSAPTVDDHVLIHQALMEEFLYEAGFSIKNGDELNYVSGTETHTLYTESRITKFFEGYGAKFYDELKLSQNGVKIWFVHQWVGVGNGHNEGNPIVNALKAIYFNHLKEQREMPDVVVASHFHKASLSSYSQNWKTYYGIITPSFQMKTRFGQKVSAFQRNDIGVSFLEVSENGLIGIREPMIMK